LAKQAVIAVARNVWHPIASAWAAAARRRIIRQASGWLIGLMDSVVPLWPGAGRNSQPHAVLADAGRELARRRRRVGELPDRAARQ
jgi:hypothetical protein